MIIMKSGAINSMGGTEFIEEKVPWKLYQASYLREMRFELNLELRGGFT